VTGRDPEFGSLTAWEVHAAQRRDAVDNARAITAIAGGNVSDEMEALNERFITGELTADEVVAERIRQLR